MPHANMIQKGLWLGDMISANDPNFLQNHTN